MRDSSFGIRRFVRVSRRPFVDVASPRSDGTLWQASNRTYTKMSLQRERTVDLFSLREVATLTGSIEPRGFWLLSFDLCALPLEREQPLHESGYTTCQQFISGESNAPDVIQFQHTGNPYENFAGISREKPHVLSYAFLPYHRFISLTYNV